LDQSAIEAIRAMDGPALIRGVEDSSCELCGAGPVATVLLAAQQLGFSRVSILKYTDSSEASGDSSAVVGYLAAAISKGKEGKDPSAGKGSKGSLSGHKRGELLKMARKSIEIYLEKGKVWEPQVSDPELREPGAAFVTLTKDGELRGCIGHTEPILPLYRTIIQCAIAAATSDPRFPPLKPAELRQVKIEISVLSPLRGLQDASEIQVGRDGILIEKGGRKGLLLPQVATEFHWDRRTFLEETCRKAGLPRDAWKEGAKVFIFSAEIFHEER
jgi:AmmeMemoRadiSam system protein A